MYDIVPKYSMEIMYLHDNKNFFIVIVIVIAAFLVVRSVNESRDTRNCVQNKPEYAICVIFTTRSYYKALGLILC